MGSSAVLEDIQYVLNQWLLCGALPSSIGIQKSGNQRVEEEEAPLTVISSDSLAKSFALFSYHFRLCWKEALVAREG